jgi:hypothetical protein
MTLFTTQNSVTELSPPTAVVCHDAGAANIIQAIIAAQPSHDWRPAMFGPAARSWHALGLVTPTLLTSVESALDGAALLLSGTGWYSDVEHKARKLARAQGISNVAVLDHWVNYKERFLRDGELVLPDEIYVTDEYALSEARKTFPSIVISQHENLYIAKQLSDLARLKGKADEVLYLLEPIRSDWPRHEAGEFEALKYFLEHWDGLMIPANATLRLRPHPSESPNKYIDWLASNFTQNRRIVIDENISLAKAMAHARWVVGCETNAMVVALYAGCKVISTLPPWAPRCRLPHLGITHLRELQLSRRA